MAKPIHDDFDDTEMFTPPDAPVAKGNPLSGYFRIPGLHVQLPTRGAFMPKGSIAFTQAGDLPVLPMRAQDELLLKSPDALMSGYAIESLLASCVPDIHNARLISSPDLDVLLLAIRAATYGEMMSLTVSCPHCQHDNAFDCHLPTLLNSMTEIDVDAHVRLSDDVVAYVRPYNVSNATDMALAGYEESQKIRALEQDEETGQNAKIVAMNKSMDRLTSLKFNLMADCVMRVVVPGQVVSDRRHIAEFVGNISKPWSAQIEAKINEINSGGMDKTLDVRCAKCNHKWKTEVEFNPSNFFDGGSSR